MPKKRHFVKICETFGVKLHKFLMYRYHFLKGTVNIIFVHQSERTTTGGTPMQLVIFLPACLGNNTTLV